MFADTMRLSARASGLRRSAEDLRSRVSGVIAHVEQGAWSSRSGESLRSSARAMAAELGRGARHLDDAAEALDAHVRAVEGLTSRSDAVVR